MADGLDSKTDFFDQSTKKLMDRMAELTAEEKALVAPERGELESKDEWAGALTAILPLLVGAAVGGGAGIGPAGQIGAQASRQFFDKKEKELDEQFEKDKTFHRAEKKRLLTQLEKLKDKEFGLQQKKEQREYDTEKFNKQQSLISSRAQMTAEAARNAGVQTAVINDYLKETRKISAANSSLNIAYQRLQRAAENLPPEAWRAEKGLFENIDSIKNLAGRKFTGMFGASEEANEYGAAFQNFVNKLVDAENTGVATDSDVLRFVNALSGGDVLKTKDTIQAISTRFMQDSGRHVNQQIQNMQDSVAAGNINDAMEVWKVKTVEAPKQPKEQKATRREETPLETQIEAVEAAMQRTNLPTAKKRLEEKLKKLKVELSKQNKQEK